MKKYLVFLCALLSAIAFNSVSAKATIILSYSIDDVIFVPYGGGPGTGMPLWAVKATMHNSSLSDQEAIISYPVGGTIIDDGKYDIKFSDNVEPKFNYGHGISVGSMYWYGAQWQQQFHAPLNPGESIPFIFGFFFSEVLPYSELSGKYTIEESRMTYYNSGVWVEFQTRPGEYRYVPGGDVVTFIHGPYSFTIPVNPVPEPATMLLFGIGILGLAGFGRKKFKKK